MRTASVAAPLTAGKGSAESQQQAVYVTAVCKLHERVAERDTRKFRAGIGVVSGGGVLLMTANGLGVAVLTTRMRRKRRAAREAATRKTAAARVAARNDPVVV